ncbi:DUF642 domain-containing protein [Paraglaciecola sp. 2405UD69-4]|uniref:DUF642 domain-containing protein n=1 Tax=Paraglaciecola sp. 2405UD69-4 TaxID=3391836 RepID=UPI0039C8EE43
MHVFRMFVVMLIMNVSTCTLASANLISNGSFEDTVIKDNSWAWFNAGAVDGWNGSNIEIWNAFKNVAAYDGSQHIELNAHRGGRSPYSISQTFATEVGEFYDISFAYSARASDQEAFWVNLIADNDTNLFSGLMDDHQVGQWSVFTTSFQAVDLTTTLSFTSAEPYYGSVGNFLDNIAVTQTLPLQLITEVPEPVGMMFLGIAFLALMRSRLLKSVEKKTDGI